MRLSHFSRSYIVILVGIIALTLSPSWSGVAQNGKSSLSGRVVDMDGKPVADLELAIKPVEIKKPRDIVPRVPFSSWLRVVTDKDGHFSFQDIDSVSSQFVMFPESASDFEIISVEIADLTFYSTGFLQNFPTWFGKLTFTIEPGTHLEDVVVNVIVKYEGTSAKSEWFRLKEGQRYDELVLVLKDLEEHLVWRSDVFTVLC